MVTKTEKKEPCCSMATCPCCECCICICTKELKKLLSPKARKLLLKELA